MAKSMGKEVKITIGVLSVLLGAFGALLYYRMRDTPDTPPGPHIAEQLAEAANAKSAKEPTDVAPADDEAASTGATDWGITDDRWAVPTAPQSNTVDDQFDTADPAPAAMPRPDTASSRRRPTEQEPAQPFDESWSTDSTSAQPYADEETDSAMPGQDPFARDDYPVSADTERYSEPSGFAQPDEGAMTDDRSQPAQIDDYAVDPAAEMVVDEPSPTGALEPADNFEPSPHPRNAAGGRYQSQPNDVAPTSGYESAPYEREQSMPTPATPSTDYGYPRYGQSSEPTEYHDQFGEPGQLPSEPGMENFARTDDRYVVATADNYWVISKKLYGTGGYFKALYEHNKGDYPRADQLRAGDEISAPSIAVLERTYPHLCPRPFRTSAAERGQAAPVAATSRQGGRRNYVVEEGDTLFDIAKQELGRASRWVEIYDMNRAALGDNVDLLRPGTELVLPAADVERTSRRPTGTYQR